MHYFCFWVIHIKGVSMETYKKFKVVMTESHTKTLYILATCADEARAIVEYRIEYHGLDIVGDADSWDRNFETTRVEGDDLAIEIEETGE